MERSEIESKLTDLLVDELGLERDKISSAAKFDVLIGKDVRVAP